MSVFGLGYIRVVCRVSWTAACISWLAVRARGATNASDSDSTGARVSTCDILLTVPIILGVPWEGNWGFLRGSLEVQASFTANLLSSPIGSFWVIRSFLEVLFQCLPGMPG